MNIEALNVEDYISKLPNDRIEPFAKLRQEILTNLPEGFEEELSYNMPSYVVPLSLYPQGYHCKKDTPLPFVSIASQKNFIGFYHMGIYAMPELKDWFEKEYTQHVPSKLDMGKSCVRLKKMEQIPYRLFGELMTKVSVKEWIDCYENLYKK